MRRVLLIVLTLVVSSSLALAQRTRSGGSASASNRTSAAKQGRQVNLASNTALAAQLENSLDARRAKVGDSVVLKTTQAVKQDGEVIVPKGARLIGRVTEVQQRTKSNGESRIGFAFDRLQKDALDMPITATIVSITQARAQTAAMDSSMDSDMMSSSSTRSSTRSSDGVGNPVGGVVSTTTSTVGNVAGNAARALGGTVGATTNTTTTTAGNLTGSLKGLQISQSGSASADGASTLSLGTGNLHLESGTTFHLLVSSSTSPGTPQ